MKEDADWRVTLQVHSMFFPPKRKAFPSSDMSQGTAMKLLGFQGNSAFFMGLWQDNQANGLIFPAQIHTRCNPSLESFQGMQEDGKSLLMVPVLRQLLLEEGHMQRVLGRGAPSEAALTAQKATFHRHWPPQNATAHLRGRWGREDSPGR